MMLEVPYKASFTIHREPSGYEGKGYVILLFSKEKVGDKYCIKEKAFFANDNVYTYYFDLDTYEECNIYENNQNYIDLYKLTKAYGAVEISRNEVESLGFTNLNGCEEFLKLGGTGGSEYYCKGKDAFGNYFFRELGISSETENGTTIVEFNGHDLPLYVVTVVYTRKVFISDKNHTWTEPTYVTVWFEKDNTNNCVREIYYRKVGLYTRRENGCDCSCYSFVRDNIQAL